MNDMTQPARYFEGTGAVRALLRTFDWADHPLGPPHTWPTELLTTVELMLDSSYPAMVAWGNDPVMLYNDAYGQILAERHPAALGASVAKAWADTPQAIESVIHATRLGEASFFEDVPFTIPSHGVPDQRWFTYSYSPIRLRGKGIGGVYASAIETTARVFAETRQTFQLRLTDQLRNLSDANAITATACAVLGELIGVDRVGYAELDADGTTAHIKSDWISGNLPSMAGQSWRLDGFDSTIEMPLQRGEVLTVDDIANDPRCVVEARVYQGLGIGAAMAIPLMKGGRLRAFLQLHQGRARHWSALDIALAADMVERTGAAAERAYAEHDRHQAEQQLRTNAQRQGFALTLADRLRALSVPDDITAAASELLGQHLNVARVFYAEVDAAQENFVIRHDWRRDGATTMAGEVRRLDDFGPDMIATLKLGTCSIVDDVTQDPSTAQFAKAYERIAVRAHIAIPLIKAGRLSVVLALQEATPRVWTEYDVQIAADVVERTWAAVENAHAQAILRAERDQSRHIFDSMADGFALFDRHWTVLEINAEGLRLTQRRPEQVIGRNHWEVWPESLGTELEQLYRAAMQSRQPNIAEYRYPLPEGGHRWLEIRINPVAGGNLAVFFRDVSQRRLADQNVRDSEAKLHQLANSIPQLAWMAGPDGAIHWYNDRWYAYTGCTPADMLGWGWQSVHHPDTLPWVMELWQHSIGTGEPFQMTFPLRGVDGTYRSFFTLVSPLRDQAGQIVQWFGTNTDVSDLLAAEHALRVSEERLQQGLLAARMAVWEWNLQTGESDSSANATAIFGHQWRQLEWDAVHPDDRPRLQHAFDAALRSVGSFQEIVRMTQVGSDALLHVDIRGKVVAGDDGVAQIVRGISVDVTERMQAMDELRNADRRKDEFLAMLAHELRNPLAPISSAAYLLKMPGVDEQRIRKTSEIIGRQVRHMTNLIDDLLDVSRVTRGLVTLDKVALDLKPIVNSAIEQVRPLIEARQHHLTVQLAAEAALVQGDRTRLVQIIANLLNNAAKYTNAGGQLQLRVDVTATEVTVTVRDNGVGIEASLLPHVFELFAQGQRTPDRAQGGLGLGLALVRSLMTLHGGSVEAFSAGTGQGSRFTLHLPLLRASLRANAPTLPQHTVLTRSLRLMVVDDNVDAAQTLAMLLEALGHTVRIFHDARSALAQVAEPPPHACILDIGLPDMDGYQLARAVRALPQMADTTLIALTGYGQQHDRAQSRAAGFSHHLVKPVDNRQLMQILAQLQEAPIL